MTWKEDVVTGTGWMGAPFVVGTTQADVRFVAIADLPAATDVEVRSRLLAPVGEAGPYRRQPFMKRLPGPILPPGR